MITLNVLKNLRSFNPLFYFYKLNVSRYVAHKNGPDFQGQSRAAVSVARKIGSNLLTN